MVPLAHRWAALDIKYTEPLWGSVFLTHLPQLRHLILNSYKGVNPLNPRLNPPGLASVSIIYPRVAGQTSILSGWMGDRLRSLELRWIYSCDLHLVYLLNVIATNPSLERLDIYGASLDNPDSSELSRFQAQCLRHIGLHYCTSLQSTADILTHLIIPTDSSIAFSFGMNVSRTIACHPRIKWFAEYLVDRITALPEECAIQAYKRDAGAIGFRCPIASSRIDVVLCHGYDKPLMNSALGPMILLLRPVLYGQRKLDLTALREYLQADGHSVFLSWGTELVELTSLAIPSSADLLSSLISPLENDRWVFPNLRHLQLTGMWQSQLLDLIRNRREDPATWALESVTLRKAEQDSATLDILTSLVPRVLITKGKHVLHPVS
ncbi:hypothetical protein FRB90_003174 [Tulasnella sp. 427]|nr:hypothetical protein FRB90_003174 [Tulasnella sp. 427]